MGPGACSTCRTDLLVCPSYCWSRFLEEQWGLSRGMMSSSTGRFVQGTQRLPSGVVPGRNLSSAHHTQTELWVHLLKLSAALWTIPVVFQPSGHGMPLLHDFSRLLWLFRQTAFATFPRRANYVGNAHQGLLSMALDLQR